MNRHWWVYVNEPSLVGICTRTVIGGYMRMNHHWCVYFNKSARTSHYICIYMHTIIFAQLEKCICVLVLKIARSCCVKDCNCIFTFVFMLLDCPCLNCEYVLLTYTRVCVICIIVLLMHLKDCLGLSCLDIDITN